MKTFTEKVIAVVSSIPRGKVLTYKEVAKKAGSPQAVRVVGTILKKNTDMNVPCHRVIKSDGTMGQYNGLRGRSKEELLRNEGYTGR